MHRFIRSGRLITSTGNNGPGIVIEEVTVIVVAEGCILIVWNT